MTDECPETEYTIAANISQLEWKILQDLRWLRTQGFGSLYVQIHEGDVTECERSLKDDRQLLKKLQERKA